MISFIYLETVQENYYKFDKPIMRQIRANFPEAMLYDLDTGSSPELFHHIDLLLEDSLHTFLIVHCDKNTQHKSLSILSEKILKYRHKLFCLMIGENSLVQKILHLGGKDRTFVVATEEDAIDLIRTLMQRQQ